MASGMSGDAVTPGNAVHLCIVCDSEAEVHTLFNKLSKGGTVGHPVSKFFAGTMGDCTDKFGIGWMLYHGGNEQQ